MMPSVIDFDRAILNRAAPQGFKADRPQGRITVENKADEATIIVYDEIGPEWMGLIGAETFAKALGQAKNAKSVHVRIESDGGQVFDGLAIYNMLVQHPAEILVTIDGMAASIASVIAMAGDSIAMAQNAQLMIHKPSTVYAGEAEDFDSIAGLLRSIQVSITDIYADRTGISKEQLTEWINAATYFSAEKAKEYGFVDTIVPNKVKNAASTTVKNKAELTDSTGDEGDRLQSFAAKNRLRLLELASVDV